jgi:hypothetical protein
MTTRLTARIGLNDPTRAVGDVIKNAGTKYRVTHVRRLNTDEHSYEELTLEVIEKESA